MPSFVPGQLSFEQQKELAKNISYVLSTYKYIIDSFIIEFFSEHLWEKLPGSWQEALSDVSAPQLSFLLLEKKQSEELRYKTVWPLSLLAFRATAHALAFPRNSCCGGTNKNNDMPEEFRENCSQSSLLKHHFRKHVKPKKQHEIRQLGKLVKRLCELMGCQQVVDVGSGQGHLSRFLSFGLGLSVTGIEADRELVTMAVKFDEQLIKTLQKEMKREKEDSGTYSNTPATLCVPQHVVGFVDPSASWKDFLVMLQSKPHQWELQGNSKLERSMWLSSAASIDCSDAVFSEHVRKSEISSSSEDKVKTEQQKHQLPTSECSYHDLNSFLCKSESEEIKGHPTGNHTETSSSSFILNGKRITKTCCSSNFMQCLKPSDYSSGDAVMLTGLHACGDLSTTLLRYFANCPEVIAITSVACCYMKISTEDVPSPPGVLNQPLSFQSEQCLQFGYPMSKWMKALPTHKLSYKSRELACHAIEDYMDHLKTESQVLCTHCYRAVLEVIIQGVSPSKKRAGIQTIKKAHKLSFEEYARLGLQKVGLNPSMPLDVNAVQSMLGEKNKVLAYFCLALLMAPLVETLILLDRMIYLQEQGFHSMLIPLFDPHFSPRNLVLVATKTGLPGVSHLIFADDYTGSRKCQVGIPRQRIYMRSPCAEV